MTTKTIKSRIINCESPYICYIVKWTVEPFDLETIFYLFLDLDGSDATTPYSSTALYGVFRKRFKLQNLVFVKIFVQNILKSP